MTKKYTYKSFYLVSMLFCLLTSFSTANALNHPSVSTPNGPITFYYWPSIDISTDGKKLYVINDDPRGEMRIVNLESKTIDRIPDIRGNDIITAPSGNSVYVASDEQLKLIDVVNQKLGMVSPTTNYTYSLAIDRSGDSVYYASLLKKSVTIFDANKNQIIKTIEQKDNSNPTCQRFDKMSGFTAIAINPNGKKLYLADASNKSLAVLDLNTDELKLNVIPTSQCPTRISVNPYTNRLYVGSMGKTVDVIDTTTDKLVTTIRTGDYARNVVITSDGKKAYILQPFDGIVNVVDMRDNHIIRKLKPHSLPWTGISSKDGRYVYLVNTVYDNKDFRITVIDTLTDKVVDSIPLN